MCDIVLTNEGSPQHRLEPLWQSSCRSAIHSGARMAAMEKKWREKRGNKALGGVQGAGKEGENGLFYGQTHALFVFA